MPEMPEVETTRRSLKILVGRTIESIHLSKLAPVETTTPTKICRTLNKTTIITLKRQGKYLLLQNEAGHALVIHLGMSGQLRFFEGNLPSPVKHIHMEIKFTDGSRLRFIDARRFGTLSLAQQVDYQDNPFLARLGPNYDDKNFSTREFIQRCRQHPKLSLKSLTLNQSVAAGLGNIYACEALYRAKLDPRRLVKSTPDRALAKLLHTAREALAQGLTYGGVSMRDYLSGLGHRATMKDFLLVYGREGQLSLDGRGKVHRIIQNARSTFFVPTVQK